MGPTAGLEMNLNREKGQEWIPMDGPAWDRGAKAAFGADPRSTKESVVTDERFPLQLPVASMQSVLGEAETETELSVQGPQSGAGSGSAIGPQFPGAPSTWVTEPSTSWSRSKAGHGGHKHQRRVEIGGQQEKIGENPERRGHD